MFKKEKMMKEVVIKIPVTLLEMDFVKEFLERIKLEMAINRLSLDEKELITLAEEIKQTWWEENGKKFLEGSSFCSFNSGT